VIDQRIGVNPADRPQLFEAVRRGADAGVLGSTLDVSSEIQMVEQDRRPTGVRNRRGSPSVEHGHVEMDIEAAARTLMPVLITAQPGRALEISRAIASRRVEAHAKDVLVCDPVAGEATIGRLAREALGRAAGNGIAIVLFRQVAAWDAAEQATIMNLLANRQPHLANGGPSIVVSSSIPL
jgi:hypothetical protein